MPQLDACGLSETWLQKTCGARHWRGLEAAVGLPAERWVDAGGKRLYAAFGLLRLRLDPATAGVGPAALEGRPLAITSTVGRLGGAQGYSQHRVAGGGAPLGTLEMLSVFVGRGDDGGNRSVRRAAVQGAPQAPLPPRLAAQAEALDQQARGWRAEVGHGLPPPQELLDCRPCPRGDFNGAGLLYFSSYTGWTDRALWHWGLLASTDRVAERSCLFLGNADIGEPLQLALLEHRHTPQGRQLTVAVRARPEQRLLAVVQLRLAA